MAEKNQNRLRRAWDVFRSRDPTEEFSEGYSFTVTSCDSIPNRPVLSRGSEKTIINAIYNRISVDVSEVDIRHVKLDENDRYQEDMDSSLNYCFKTEWNIDQTAREGMRDLVSTMLSEGVAAVVPTKAKGDPITGESFDVRELRVGKIIQWYPQKVKIDLYDDKDGRHKQVILPKKMVAIIPNPFYMVMNSKNSTMQRLIHKLALMDMIDDQNSSGKLDLIVQLPYTIKTEARKQEAHKRRSDIEEQLRNSKYGVAYIDGTEKIIQLNRPIENTLQSQVEYFTNTLMSQLGITMSILDGTADEQTQTNYMARIVAVILNSIVENFNRTFLSKTARTQKQAIKYYTDPFKLVPVTKIPDLADSLTRNEVVTSNEVRQGMGFKPSSDPNADQLRNKNITQPEGYEEYYEEEENQNEA